MENSVNKKNIIISKTSKKFYALLDCNISINENELNIIMPGKNTLRKFDYYSI